MDLIIPVVVLVILTVITTLLFKFFFFSKNQKFDSKTEQTDTEKLLAKKYDEVDIHRQRGFTLIAGFFVTMAFTVVLVEYGRRAIVEEEVVKVQAQDAFDEIEAPPPTAPPPPPPAPKTIVLVENDQIEIEPEKDSIPEVIEKDEVISFEIEDEEEEEEEEEEVVEVGTYDFVEQEPVSPVGDVFAFAQTYVMPRINKAAIKPDIDAGRKGYFELKFIVMENGSLANFEVVSSVGRYIDAEIIRVVKTSPRWTPGEMQGQKVRTIYYMPLQINY